MQAEVQDNHARSRFELDAGDGAVAFLDYERRGDVVVLIHTEVPAALSGRGIGQRLVRGVLDAVRAEGRRIVPRCSFVAGYVARHPEYQDLVAQPG